MAQAQVNYQVLQERSSSEVQQQFQQRLKMRAAETGNKLRHAILHYVVDQQYQIAKRELQAFVSAKTEYPQFQDKANRYVEHCLDLISAIEAKRGFHGMNSLSFSKQQELFDKVIEHFDELTEFLKRIEFVEKDARLIDVRSTVWIVQTISVCAFSLLVFGFISEINGNVINTVISIIDSDLSVMAKAIYKLIGL